MERACEDRIREASAAAAAQAELAQEILQSQLHEERTAAALATEQDAAEIAQLKAQLTEDKSAATSNEEVARLNAHIVAQDDELAKLKATVEEAAKAQPSAAQDGSQSEELLRLRALVVAHDDEVAKMQAVNSSQMEEIAKLKAVASTTQLHSLPVEVVSSPEVTSLNALAVALEERTERIEAEALAQRRRQLCVEKMKIIFLASSHSFACREAERAELSTSADFIATQLAILRSVQTTHAAQCTGLLLEQKAALIEEKQAIEATLQLLRQAKEEGGNSADAATKIDELQQHIAKLEKQVRLQIDSFS